MAAFVLSRYSKSLNDGIENTWKMNNASASIERKKTTRMEILRSASLRVVVMAVKWSGISVLGKCSS